MADYANLDELTRASSHNLGDPNATQEFVAYVDNDVVTFRRKGDPSHEDVLELHPSEVVEQALQMLGITVESV